MSMCSGHKLGLENILLGEQVTGHHLGLCSLIKSDSAINRVKVVRALKSNHHTLSNSPQCSVTGVLIKQPVTQPLCFSIRVDSGLPGRILSLYPQGASAE